VGLGIERAAGEADLALLEVARPPSAQARAWLRDLDALAPIPCIGDWFDLGGRYFFLDTVMHLRRHGVKFLRLLIMMDPRKPQQPAAADSDTLRPGTRWIGMGCCAREMHGPIEWRRPTAWRSRWTGVGV